MVSNQNHAFGAADVEKVVARRRKGPKKFSLKIVTLTPPTLLVAAVAQYIMQQSEIGFVSTRYSSHAITLHQCKIFSIFFWIVETLPQKIVSQYILTFILVHTEFNQRDEMEMKQCLNFCLPRSREGQGMGIVRDLGIQTFVYFFLFCLSAFSHLETLGGVALFRPLFIIFFTKIL